MRLVVLEHFTSRPAGAPRALLAEGRAMRDALAEDWALLPGFRVTVLQSKALDAPAPRGARLLPVDGDLSRVLRAALRHADAALLIAPEDGGTLESLCRVVEDCGRVLLGPSAAAVRLAADKHATTRMLRAAGIPAVRGTIVTQAGAAEALRSRPLPLVVKPRDSCGCRGVSVVRDGAAIDPALRRLRRATARCEVLIEDYLEGDAASVALVAYAGRGRRCGSIALGLNRQRLRETRGRVAYLGGETPWPHPQAAAAIRAARRAVAALQAAAGGVRGLLGVDLVLTRRGGPRVVEINPRPTTSYIGLRRVARGNLAALVRDAVLGIRVPAPPDIRGRCLFSGDGSIRSATFTHEPACATTIGSAGTSAASI